MDEIDKDFIEMYKTLGASFGIDNLFMTLFAKIYIEPEEISMNDLAKGTGYSLASISSKIKLLESAGIVKRTSKPGSKKVFFYTEKNFTKIIKSHLIKKEESCFKLMKLRIPEIIKKHKNKLKSEKEKRKLKILEDYNNQIIRFEKILSEIMEKIEKLEP